MTVDLYPKLCEQALAEALDRFPQFAAYGPQIVGRALFQGVAYQLTWREQPPKEMTDAWEFQNIAVKAYRRLAGV